MDTLGDLNNQKVKTHLENISQIRSLSTGQGLKVNYLYNNETPVETEVRVSADNSILMLSRYKWQNDDNKNEIRACWFKR